MDFADTTTRFARSLLMHYPCNTPRARLLKLLPQVPRNCSGFRVKGGMRIVACQRGNSDLISRSLYWLGDFDPWVVRVADLLLRPGDTALDLGANIGSVALRMARRVGSGGRVHCVEPFPPSISMLRHNVCANALSNVVVHELAISSSSGSLRIGLPDAEAGHAHIANEHAGISFDVRSSTLDSFVRKLGSPRIKLCKIDVEGHEPAVLEGASELLRSKLIEAFLFERYCMPNIEDDAVLRTLRDHGYQVWRIHKHFLRVTISDPAMRRRGRATPDFVSALPQSAAHEALQKMLVS
jgi:FkbM family methyltransferase